VQSKTATRGVDALGLLTIVAYGSWFYGFGVLVGDMSRDLKIGVGVLGTIFGATTLAGGCGAVAIARILDRRGPPPILRIIGPAAALLYCVPTVAPNGVTFALSYLVAGGLISATGFYSITQPLVMRLRPDDPLRAITRLTIWGALSSPIAIPITELLRQQIGWRSTSRVVGLVLFAAFLFAAFATRGLTAGDQVQHANLRAIFRSAVASRFLRLYGLSLFLSAMSVSALIVFQVPVMKWSGLSAATAATLAGARGLLQLLGRLPLMPVVTRFGAWRVQTMCRQGIIIGAVALLLAGSRIFAVLYVVVIGACAGALSALDGMVSHEVLPRENFATTVALLGFVATLGSAIGPILVGIAVQITSSVGTVPGLVVLFATGAVVGQRLAGKQRNEIR
jgi:predicted MFS family arabinose efflux permease